jgi:hypothetical protein
MLIEVGRGVRYVRLTRPQFGGGQPPAKSSDDDTLRVHALIYAFGSTRMQDLLDSWEDATNEFAWIDKSLSTLENRPEPSRDRGWELEWEGRSAELEPARKAALDRADEIIALANNELPDAERVAALAFELGPHGLMVWVGGLTGLR